MPWPYLLYDEVAGRLLVNLARNSPRHAAPEVTVSDPDVQEDLTRDDYLAVTTQKVFDADDELPQPPQNQRWVPETVVDEHGRAVGEMQ